MPKIDINPEISFKLKEWRLKYKVKSKDLAAHIQKSPAYISKLENGEIKQIDSVLLKDIVTFICNDSGCYEDFILDATKDINSEELKDLGLFINYDTLERKIPVPESLIEFIKNKMLELEVNSEELCNYINKNEDLTDDFFKKHNLIKSDLPLNIWNCGRTVSKDGEPIEYSYILLYYNQKEIDDLLSGRLDRCSHTFIYSIVYHLLKLENKLNNNSKDLDQIKDQTKNLLWANKFYSLDDLRKLNLQAKTQEEFINLLNEFDYKNRELINKLLKNLSIISDYDIKYANEKITTIVNNIEEDIGFAISFMAISLAPLKEISFDLKKDFLGKVNNLIQDYSGKQSTDIIQKY